MTRNLGTYNTATTRTHVRFQFSTHAAAGGNVAPNSAFEAADLRIYRANDSAAYSATQRSSAAGITMTSPFDSLTGVHDVDIDLTDNTDAGFYAAGYRYSVVLSPDETVDGQTITGIVLAEFEIGPEPANVVQWNGTAVASPATAGYPAVTVKVGTGTGEINLSSGAVPVKGNVKKNTALAGFMFMMTDSTGHAPATGKTVTVTRSIDGGAFAGGTLSSVTEVGVGIYAVDFGAGDLNGNNIILRATAASSDDTFERIVTFVA